MSRIDVAWCKPHICVWHLLWSDAISIWPVGQNGLDAVWMLLFLCERLYPGY